MPRAKAKSSPTESALPVDIIEPLPGSAEVDAVLVDQAVAAINQIYVSKGLEAARAIAEYVVERFFGGDLEAARGFGPSGERHKSFRALALRDDLQVSHAHLWVCVRVLGQLRQLPDDIATALSISHHRRLLTVQDPNVKMRIAKKAVEKGLSVQALEAEVARQRAKETKGNRPGRKPLPTFVKAVRRLGKLDLGVGEITDEVLAGLDDGESAKLVDTIESQMKALEELKARLRAG